MSDADTSTRQDFDRVADTFSAVVRGVPDDGWDRPTPCRGWVARDVVDHLATWVPGVLAPSGLAVGDDPTAPPPQRWSRLADALADALADPDVAATEFDAGPPGRMTVESAIAMLVVGDVLLHSWDLAVATGQRVELDPTLVHRMLVGMQPLDQVLRDSGHYGPKVAVPADADEATQLLAFTGRDVAAWS